MVFNWYSYKSISSVTSSFFTKQHIKLCLTSITTSHAYYWVYYDLCTLSKITHFLLQMNRGYGGHFRLQQKHAQAPKWKHRNVKSQIYSIIFIKPKWCLTTRRKCKYLNILKEIHSLLKVWPKKGQLKEKHKEYFTTNRFVFMKPSLLHCWEYYKLFS